MNELKLKIQGMTCGSCSRGITARVSKFDFTDNVNVDWENGTGNLEITGNFEENKANVISAINQLGYKAEEA